MTLEEYGNYHNTQVYSFIKRKDIDVEYKFLLCILNSSVLWYYLKNTGNILRGGFFRFKTSFLEPFPIPDYSRINQIPFIEKADIILANTKALKQTSTAMLQLLQSNFPILQLNKKLDQWPSLTFSELIKELEKQKIKLTLSQQSEWMQYFEEQKAKAQQIQQIITATDKEIDKMVYDLYELTEEEIKIVEGQ